MDSNMKKSIKKNNIFSKAIFETVNGFVDDLIIGLVVLWESQEYHDVLNEYLHDALDELVTDDKITKHKILLTDDMQNKKMDIYIRYRQKNCLVDTTVEYHIDIK